MPPEPAAPAAFIAIVLAAQRAGVVDPLAASAGLSHKALVPVAGVPMIRHPIAALAAMPGLREIRISAEPDVVPSLRAALAGIDARLVYVPSAANLADSVHRAAEGADLPLIVTTADNVLLTPDSVGSMVAAVADGAGAVIAFARREDVLAAHPEGQRRFYKFADAAYSNCNLYALAPGPAIALAEAFRSGGQFAKKPLRLALAFGPVNLALIGLHLISLDRAARRISRRFRVTLRPIVLADGMAAIDVDNPRTHRVAEALLAARDGVARKAA